MKNNFLTREEQSKMLVSEWIKKNESAFKTQEQLAKMENSQMRFGRQFQIVWTYLQTKGVLNMADFNKDLLKSLIQNPSAENMIAIIEHTVPTLTVEEFEINGNSIRSFFN